MSNGKPLRIWSLPCPFTKDGAPVMGNFGRVLRSVVVIEYGDWIKLCEEIPELGRRQFEVGEVTR